ncbi:MAG: ATP-binding protein [Alphaproteobacteria bacterium]|nr:ATP-binding protein [Alphaproteobacteria bacterium]
MIPRDLASVLRADARHLPVLTVVGPRQSGKSTLARATFPDHAYVNLERPDLREAAREDPRTLLAQHARGAIFDEIQHVPELLSWMQVEVDERADPGRFVLTGSNQQALSAAVPQTLAGRTSVLTLLPPDLGELGRFPKPPDDLWTTLWTGAFPRIHDTGMPADRWLGSYVATYVERDVRQLVNVVDLLPFSTFLRLAAARTGQETNLSALGADAGITQPTARAWLGVLEASFLAHRIPAWFRNTRKQLVKAPKLHLVDAGLVCSLLGVRSPSELRGHPLRGPIFESWVATELIKQRHNLGLTPRIFHWRETRGVEVDLVVDDGTEILLVEVKSGATVSSDWFGPLVKARETAAQDHPAAAVRAVILFGGDEPATRHGVDVVPWREIGRLRPRDG